MIADYRREKDRRKNKKKSSNLEDEIFAIM